MLRGCEALLISAAAGTDSSRRMLLGTLARPTKQFSPRDETIFPPREDVLKRIIDTKALTTSLLEPRFLEPQMAAVARAFSRTSVTNVHVESLKTFAMVCAV